MKKKKAISHTKAYKKALLFAGIAVVIFLIGFSIGFAEGFYECANIGLKFLKTQGVDLDIDAATINKYIWEVKKRMG